MKIELGGYSAVADQLNARIRAYHEKGGPDAECNVPALEARDIDAMLDPASPGPSDQRSERRRLQSDINDAFNVDLNLKDLGVDAAVAKVTAIAKTREIEAIVHAVQMEDEIDASVPANKLDAAYVQMLSTAQFALAIDFAKRQAARFTPNTLDAKAATALGLKYNRWTDAQDPAELARLRKAGLLSQASYGDLLKAEYLRCVGNFFVDVPVAVAIAQRAAGLERIDQFKQQFQVSDAEVAAARTEAMTAAANWEKVTDTKELARALTFITSTAKLPDDLDCVLSLFKRAVRQFVMNGEAGLLETLDKHALNSFDADVHTFYNEDRFQAAIAVTKLNLAAVDAGVVSDQLLAIVPLLTKCQGVSDPELKKLLGAWHESHTDGLLRTRATTVSQEDSAAAEAAIMADRRAINTALVGTTLEWSDVTPRKQVRFNGTDIAEALRNANDYATAGFRQLIDIVIDYLPSSGTQKTIQDGLRELLEKIAVARKYRGEASADGTLMQRFVDLPKAHADRYIEAVAETLAEELGVNMAVRDLRLTIWDKEPQR